MRVLIAEDDPVARRVLESNLRKWGYEPVLAEDGAQAWELLHRDDAPELAILDWMMPGLSGIQICQHLRSRAGAAYVYIILVSSRGDRDDFVAGMDAGADDYLVKPYSPLELKQRLRAGCRILELQSALLAAQEALRERATVDDLTNIWNRRTVLEICDQERSRVRREGRPFAVALADIDHFKVVNDTHGHLAGDLVLQEVAKRVCCSVRDYDSVGRYGGEEFLIVLPDCDSRAAEALGNRLRKSISDKPILAHGKPLRITMSVGTCSLASDALETVTELIRRADVALYQAKREGRSRVVSYHPRFEAGESRPIQPIPQVLDTGAAAEPPVPFSL